MSDDDRSNEQVHGMLEAAISEVANLARSAPEAFVITYTENWAPYREHMGDPRSHNGGHIWTSENLDEAYQLASDLYDAECEAGHPENIVCTLRAAEWAHCRIKRLEELKEKVKRMWRKEISEKLGGIKLPS